MNCRRCLRGISEGAVAHLVERRKQLDAELPPSVHSVIVCSSCVRPGEKPFFEGPEEAPVPPPRLRPLQEEILIRALIPRNVYRQPRRVRLRTGPELLETDRAVTTDAYVVINRGYAEWDVVPRKERVEGGATAWLRVTAEGRAYLEMEEHDVVTTGTR